MRLIDADELMEHVGRDRLDSRELIMEMINNAPTVEGYETLRRRCRELECQKEYLDSLVINLRGEIKALAFAVRCNGVSGGDVRYEDD